MFEGEGVGVHFEVGPRGDLGDLVGVGVLI